MMYKCRIMYVMVCFCFLFFSCNENRKIMEAPEIPNGVPVTSMYDYTTFVGKNCTVRLSLIKLDSTIMENFNVDSCLISGTIFARDWRSEYSGKIFNRFDNRGPNGDPHVLIPSLNIDIVVLNGSFELIVPVGTYDILVYANGYHSKQTRLRCKSRTKYEINAYLGCNTIH